MRIGSLFAGYGGIDLALEDTLDASPAWFSEIDAAPSRILAHHWPDVPNLGDITAIDWAAVESVDILTGGFPCQDVSLAGLRRGLRPDTRSGLWTHFAAAIDALRPPLVLIENVRGLLSAEAHSDLEPDPWDLGEPGRADRPALRALGAVLGDLADLGYNAEWCGLRAADAGAPHGRFRIFIAAHPRGEALRLGTRLRESVPAGIGRRRPHHDRVPDTAPDTDRRRHGGAEDARRVERMDLGDAGEARQRERTLPIARDRSATPGTAPDARSVGRDRRPGLERTRWSESVRSETSDHARDSAIAWGVYEPAIRRWEAVVGRLAPAPTDPGPTGAQRLSPRFTEWMMGLPAGHVTDPSIGITRNEQLKALGNGVVPQQAALAVRALLARQETPA